MAKVPIDVKTRYDGKGFDNLRRAARKAARNIKSEFKNLGKEIASEFTLRDAVSALGNFSLESVKAADQARITESAFFGLSGGAEQAAANLAAMDRATRDLVSQQRQQAIANQLLSMEIVSTADELEKVVSVARRLGALKGFGAEEAADQFAIMIANMSIARLDAFSISSGNVKRRMGEMAEAAGRAANQQDFFTATMLEADRTLDRLGPELETNVDRVDRLASRWSDFKVEFGELLTSVDDASGIIKGLTDLVEDLAAGAKAWTFMIDQVILLDDALGRINETTDSTSDRWQQAVANFLPFGNQIKFGVDLIESYFFGAEQLADALEAVGEEAEEAAPKQKEFIEAAEENSAELTKIREKFARDLIRIDERMQDEIEDAWDDYFDDEQDAWKDHNKRLESIKKRHAKDLAKDDRDLQKDLAKISKNENKTIEKIRSDAAKESKRQDSIRRIDHLADERLFTFELQQLAAEGQGNAIRAALERRAIEEEIAKEKAQVEGQIEDQKLEEDIERVRTGAQERRSELRAEAAEEQQIRQEELAEQLADEEENYQERLEDLRAYREDKLVEIENSSQEAVEVLGRELAEMGDLTRSELQALVPVAAQLGEDVGKVFAFGLEKGFETNQRISQMLGQSSQSGFGIASPSQSGFGIASPSQHGFGIASPSQHGFGIDSYQSGGIVPGPIGAPQLAVVHGGETITPAGGGGINFNATINVNGGGQGVANEIVAALQEFTDTVLVPALS